MIRLKELKDYLKGYQPSGVGSMVFDYLQVANVITDAKHYPCVVVDLPNAKYKADRRTCSMVVDSLNLWVIGWGSGVMDEQVLDDNKLTQWDSLIVLVEEYLTLVNNSGRCTVSFETEWELYPYGVLNVEQEYGLRCTVSIEYWHYATP